MATERALANAARRLLGDRRLLIATNRGPVTFATSADGGLRPRRGSGGLVTALGQVGHHVPVTWVAAALSEGDRRAAAEPRLIDRALPDSEIRLRFASVDRHAFDLAYNVIANPLLWFLQHQMWDLPEQPVIDAATVRAWERGYRVVEPRLRRCRPLPVAARRRAANHAPRLPPVSRGGGHPATASGGGAQPLHPHPVATVVALADDLAGDPDRDHERPGRQRRGGLPDRALRAQLPAQRRVVPAGRARQLPGPHGHAGEWPRGPRAPLPDLGGRGRHPSGGHLPRRAASRRRADGRDRRSGDCPGRPHGTLEEHHPRLSGVRAPAAAPSAAARTGQHARFPRPVPHQPARVRRLRAQGLRMWSSGSMPDSGAPAISTSGSSTKTTTPRPSPACRWRTSSSSTR